MKNWPTYRKWNAALGVVFLVVLVNKAVHTSIEMEGWRLWASALLYLVGAFGFIWGVRGHLLKPSSFLPRAYGFIAVVYLGALLLQGAYVEAAVGLVITGLVAFFLSLDRIDQLCRYSPGDEERAASAPAVGDTV